ncbi:MAG TPA: hypothetical protein DDY78_25545 [Planctomycetales bacterium]|jgi:hypothetical protein|nr:hypothetical protein [Planctomycetales bacterium]
MDVKEIIVAGTIKPDGTLELDQKPTLAPGPVTVVLRQEVGTAPPVEEGWWPYMQRVRAEREAAGYHFMNEMEMAAHLEWLRDDEDRIDRIYREMDMEKRRQENV